MIYRAEHSNDFSQIENACLRDDRLSLEAVGLLAYMLSMSDGWKFSTYQLATHFKKNEKTILGYLNELKECGYLEIRRTRDEKCKITGSEWDIFEIPHTVKNHSVEKPQCGKTTTWKNHTVEKRVGIKNINNKNINIKNIKGKEKGDFVPPSLEEVSAYCQERQNGIDPEQFISFYASKGWKVGKHKMVDWKAAVRTWEKRQSPKTIPKKTEVNFDELMKWAEEEDRKAGGDI